MNTQTFAGLLGACLATVSSASAALVNTPNLATVRVWESTGPFVAYDFAAGGAEMNARIGLPNLGPANNDFSSLPVENYDVYFSDADGTFNPNGCFVSVEAVFPVVTPQPGGGGLNLGAVDLLDGNGDLIARADFLGSWYGRGTNYLVGSEQLAVDAADAITGPASTPPLTDTTMGNTAPGRTPLRGPLRVTVGFTGLCVPEPGATCLALTAAGLVASRGWRRRIEGERHR